jgi:hypothetical protein
MEPATSSNDDFGYGAVRIDANRIPVAEDGEIGTATNCNSQLGSTSCSA